MRSPSVANAQTALQQGSGSLAKLHHQPHCILVKRIVIFPVFLTPGSCFASFTLFLRRLQELLFLFRRALRTPELDDRRDLLFCHKGRVQAMHTG